jgi:hypothetical protein
MMFGMLRYERATGPGPAVGFVGEGHVQRRAVGFREDRDGFDTQFVRGPIDPKRDLAAIRD